MFAQVLGAPSRAPHDDQRTQQGWGGAQRWVWLGRRRRRHLRLGVPSILPRSSLPSVAALPRSFLNEAGLLDLPDSIGSLASLRKLRLNQNALRSLPPGLTALHQLQALWASGNVFREVPQVRRCSIWLRTVHLCSSGCVRCICAGRKGAQCYPLYPPTGVVPRGPLPAGGVPAHSAGAAVLQPQPAAGAAPRHQPAAGGLGLAEGVAGCVRSTQGTQEFGKRQPTHEPCSSWLADLVSFVPDRVAQLCRGWSGWT